MASQISHIVYAKKFLDKLEKGEMREDFFDNETIKRLLTHRDEFLLGCVFPDVRLVAESVSRKDTHMFFAQVNLDFRGLHAFQAGWKFHVYCDMKREEILNSYNFYEITREIEKSWMANKLLEDELVYGVYNNWEKLGHYFNNIPQLELLAGLTRETVEFWYAIIAKYIEEIPTNRTMHIFITKSKQPDVQKTNGIVEKVDQLRKNSVALEILQKVYQEIV
jgi:hypothetical protein